MPDGHGRYNEFLSDGQFKHLIVWSGSTGAWELYQAVRPEWEGRGGASGAYGYPTSGYDFGPGNGRSQAFVGGAIASHPRSACRVLSVSDTTSLDAMPPAIQWTP